ncbi:MAG: hypothetical protein AAB394_04485 [Patescibacteria group bacterium]
MNNILSILTGIAMIGASALTLEGVNKVTDGDFYLASVKYLAQESTNVPGGESVFSGDSTISIPATSATQETTQFNIPLLPNGGTPTDFQNQIQKTQTPNMMQNQPGSFEVFEKNQKVFNTIRQPLKGVTNESFEENNDDSERNEIDREQIQRSIKDISRFRTELKNTLRQIKKQASPADLEELTKIQAEVDQVYSTLSNTSDSSSAVEAMQSFHEGEYWDKVNKIRTRVQIPQELKRFQQSFKRVDKTLQAKAVQSLGLNIDKAKQEVAEMKQLANNVQSQYDSGSYEEAGESMRDLHENGQPGDIESTIARVRDIKSTLKRVKDTEVRTAAEEVLQEVIDKFNNGEYRDARETLDQYSNDLMKMLNQFAKAKTLNRSASKNQIQNLGNLIEKKLQEIDVKQGQTQESSAEFNQ